MRKAILACQLFEPLHLRGKQNDIHTLEYLVDDLKFFDYPSFTPIFLRELKEELPVAITHANLRFDWKSINPSNQFQTRMQRRTKRHDLLMKDVSQQTPIFTLFRGL